MLVPHEVMEKEFLGLAETEGIADIEELNKILDRAVNLKNFLKGKDRVEAGRRVRRRSLPSRTSSRWATRRFSSAVDREACAFYKEALDKVLPPEYSEVVFTGNNNDQAHLKKWHLDEKREKQIRKSFTKPGDQPKILIVTEKLLTGFDAPILYAMYLDKPMRDHTLLQAIARVNRPYENEAAEMVKPHGFVLDFVGIFDKLEKALAFDSDEINAIVKDIGLLKELFKNKMESKAPAYLDLVTPKFDDKDVDDLIEHFRDKDRRKEFFKEYKEIEMLYEIISPDAFLRPYIETTRRSPRSTPSCGTPTPRRSTSTARSRRRPTSWYREHIGVGQLEQVTEFVEIDADTIELIKKQQGGDGTKIINLVKSIEKLAEEESGDPFLVALSDRAKAVQESFEDRQTETADALAELLGEIDKNEERKEEQAARGLDCPDLLRSAQAHRRRHQEPRGSEQAGDGGAYQPAELATERRRTSRSSSASHFCSLRGGGQPRKGHDHRRSAIRALAEELQAMSPQMSKPAFKARVHDWAAKLDVEVNHVAIRKMSTKWASCSTEGNLTFNSELLLLEEEICDYVIVHELLHLSAPNHGRLWKSLMRAYLGDYEAVDRRLKLHHQATKSPNLA